MQCKICLHWDDDHNNTSGICTVLNCQCRGFIFPTEVSQVGLKRIRMDVKTEKIPIIGEVSAK